MYRLSIGQYNNGQSSTNNQTVINAAGTGAVVLNGSNNAGTGGVVFGSGGASETTVATINNAGNAQFNGTLQVGGTSTVRGNDDGAQQRGRGDRLYLWAGRDGESEGVVHLQGLTGNSQWYMVKDASNNWALNSAMGGLDSFKAYQSTNSGDTYINASNASGVVRVNYETGAGTGFKIYGGTAAACTRASRGRRRSSFRGWRRAAGITACRSITRDISPIPDHRAARGGGTARSTRDAGQIAYYSRERHDFFGSEHGIDHGWGDWIFDSFARLSNLGGAS